MQIVVFLFSLLLIGLIIWWFFGSHQGETLAAVITDDVQRVEVVVEGGYKPELITLKAGVPTELTFLRKSASSCFNEVLLPDFGKQASLPVNEPYVIKLTPTVPGNFTYSCGMHMFFGKIEVTA